MKTFWILSVPTLWLMVDPVVALLVLPSSLRLPHAAVGAAFRTTRMLEAAPSSAASAALLRKATTSLEEPIKRGTPSVTITRKSSELIWMENSKESRRQTTPLESVSSSAMVLMMITFFFVAISFSAPAVASDNLSPTTTTANVGGGATLFQNNCAGCHAGGKNFINEKKTLQKAALEKYLGSTEPIQIQNFVQGRMPHKLLPFSKDFSDQDYLDVASFVSDQALGEKW